jgi:hypothetical protein
MKKYSAILPHVVAVFIFAILSATYFAPQFDGYDLNQGDIRQYVGMSKEISDFRQMEKSEPLWTNSAFGGMPAYQISVSSPNIISTIEGFLIFKIFKAPFGYLVLAMISFYILLLCFGTDPWLSIVGAIAFGLSTIFILFLEGGHNSKVHAIAVLPGIIGGFIYSYRKNPGIGGALLSLFICLHLSANHIQETYYLLFLITAIIIAEFYRFYKENRLPAFFKITAFVLLASFIGISPNLPNLLLTGEYGKYSSRGKSDLTIPAMTSPDKSLTVGLERNYIKEYSMGYGEVWSLAIPDVKGGSASNRLGDYKDKISQVNPEYRNDIANFPAYWGEQSFSGGAFYFGAAIFLLFVLGIVFIKDKIKWAFLAASALAVVLSWKYSAILDFFIDYVPLFNKFRDTKMILVLVQISFPLLGMLFLDELFKKQLDRKKLLYAMGATMGGFLIFYILPSLWFSFFNNEELIYFDKQASQYPQALQQINLFKANIEQVRIAIFQADVLRSIIFMVFAAGLILLYTRNKIAKQYFILSMGILVLIDIWMVDKRYLNNDINGSNWIKSKDRNIPYTPRMADNQILKWEVSENNSLKEKIAQNDAQFPASDNQNAKVAKANLAFSTLNFETDYRVLSLENPFANASTSYYHKSIGGYHGAKLKRYAELIEFRLNKECQVLINTVKSGNDTLLNNSLKSQIPALNMLNTKYIIYNPDAAPIKNPYANGTVWIVKNTVIVKNADQEIMTLDSIDTKITAVIDQSFTKLIPQSCQYDSLATIQLKSYRPNHLTYESSTENEQVAVFSEIYYKDGWNAFIDGKSSPYFRADYVLRAVTIPAGKHTIEFKFEPETYYLSKKLSYAGSALILIFALGIVLLEIINRKKEQTIHL